MNYLSKAKTRGNGDMPQGSWPDRIESEDAALRLIEYYEGNGQHAQAVRIRLWNGMVQREAHRPLVEKWLASGLAFNNPPPPVPGFAGRGEFIDETQDRKMARAMWLLSRGKVSQQQVNGWPARWRQVGATQGYLNADGTLRFTA